MQISEVQKSLSKEKPMSSTFVQDIADHQVSINIFNFKYYIKYQTNDLSGQFWIESNFKAAGKVSKIWLQHKIKQSINLNYWHKFLELLLGATRYTTSIDLWSAGCIFVHVLLGKPLFIASNNMDQVTYFIIYWTLKKLVLCWYHFIKN